MLSQANNIFQNNLNNLGLNAKVFYPDFALKNNLISYENQIQFLTQYPSVNFLYDTVSKIYIGSAGYNINKTIFYKYF